MGYFINPDNTLFAKAVNTEPYVDKSMIIDTFNKAIGTYNNKFCVTRPEGFGKTTAVNMLIAYYSKGCNSKELFSKLKIAQTADFEKHLNKYNVIHINMEYVIKESSKKYEEFDGYDFGIDGVLKFVEVCVAEELKALCPFINLDDYKESDPYNKIFGYNLEAILKDIRDNTDERFILIIDDWNNLYDVAHPMIEQSEYVNFLYSLLYEKHYFEMVYITGVLPFKMCDVKLNFMGCKEISLIYPNDYGEFIGLTESEVRFLCYKYDVSFKKVTEYFGGYTVNNCIVYNTGAVIKVVTENDFSSHVTKAGVNDVFHCHIGANHGDMSLNVLDLLKGLSKPIKLKRPLSGTGYKDYDTIATILVVTGYLTRDDKTNKVKVPDRMAMVDLMEAIYSNKKILKGICSELFKEVYIKFNAGIVNPFDTNNSEDDTDEQSIDKANDTDKESVTSFFGSKEEQNTTGDFKTDKSESVKKDTMISLTEVMLLKGDFDNKFVSKQTNTHFGVSPLKVPSWSKKVINYWFDEVEDGDVYRLQSKVELHIGDELNVSFYNLYSEWDIRVTITLCDTETGREHVSFDEVFMRDREWLTFTIDVNEEGYDCVNIDFTVRELISNSIRPVISYNGFEGYINNFKITHKK